MRLLNIETGYLEIVNIEDVKNNYVAVSHRLLHDEINLLDLSFSGIDNIVNIGKELFQNLYKKII